MNKSVCGVRASLRVLTISGFLLFATGCTTFGSGPVSGLSPDVSNASDTRRVFPNTIRKHIYAGIGVGASRLEPDTSDVSTLDLDDRKDSGAQVTLGIDLSRQIAIEAHASELGSAGIIGAGDVPDGTVDYQSAGASALYYLGGNRNNFRRKGFSGYGRLGYGILNSSATNNLPHQELNGAHVLFGGGLEYMTKSGLGIRAEAISFDTDVNYTQLALIYRTGRRERQRNLEVVDDTVLPTPAIAAALPAAQSCEFSGDQTDINFHTDSEQLTIAAKQMLDGFADELLECNAASLRVSAHTDSRGAQTYNDALSARRANSVVDYLNDKGVEQTRLHAQYYGELQPIASNGTPEGRRINRRVELFLEN